jgi:hypothetical protein
MGFADWGKGASVATASHILIKDEGEALRLLARIEKGEMRFEAAAAEFSTCGSASKGGALGSFRVRCRPRTGIGPSVGSPPGASRSAGSPPVAEPSPRVIMYERDDRAADRASPRSARRPHVVITPWAEPSPQRAS